MTDLKFGKDRNGFRFGEGLEKLLICLLVFEGWCGSSCRSMLTLLCMGDDRFVGGGNAWPRTGASVRNAHHDDACQLRTDPNRRHPKSNSGSGKLTDSPLLLGGGSGILLLSTQITENMKRLMKMGIKRVTNKQNLRIASLMLSFC